MSDFEIISITENVTKEAVHEVDAVKSEVTSQEVDLRPLIKLHDLIKNSNDPDSLPKITRENSQQLALDQLYFDKGWEEQKSQHIQELPIYESLVATISSLNLGAENINFGLLCSTEINYLKTKIYEELVNRYKKDETTSHKYYSEEVAEEAQYPTLWAEAVEMATIVFLESFKDFEIERGTFDHLTIRNSKYPNKSIGVFRLSANEANNELIGGNAQECKDMMQKELDKAIQLFDELGIAVNDKMDDIYIYPPELDLASKNKGGIGFSLYRGGATTIGLANFGKEEELASRIQSRNIREFAGHEIIHGLTRINLPTAYKEAVAVLYQMINNDEGEAKNARKVFQHISENVNGNFLANIDRISKTSANKGQSKTLTNTELYDVPAAFLYVLYAENPKACGQVLKSISADFMLDREINIRGALKSARENTQLALTDDEIENKVQALISKSKKY